MRFGAYEVVAEIGRGGMGVVYEAKGAGRRVAVKVIAREHADERFRARFAREARAAAAIAHPNVTAVLETGIEDGAPFIVFEHCPGGTLAARTGERGKLPWREAAAFGIEIARGLAA